MKGFFMDSINWDVIPKHIVAISAHSDFSGGSFYTIDGSGLNDVDGDEGINDILIGVRPSAALEVISTLVKRVSYLEGRIESMRDGCE